VNECRQYIVVYIASSSLDSIRMVLVYRDQKVSCVDVICTHDMQQAYQKKTVHVVQKEELHCLHLKTF
jgi:hypothetical protein